MTTCTDRARRDRMQGVINFLSHPISHFAVHQAGTVIWLVIGSCQTHDLLVITWAAKFPHKIANWSKNRNCTESESWQVLSTMLARSLSAYEHFLRLEKLRSSKILQRRKNSTFTLPFSLKTLQSKLKFVPARPCTAKGAEIKILMTAKRRYTSGYTFFPQHAHASSRSIVLAAKEMPKKEVIIPKNSK